VFFVSFAVFLGRVVLDTRSNPLRVRLGHLDSKNHEHHDAKMRTTVTLDDDVESKLRQLAQRRRISFKEAVNSVLRRGLTAQEQRKSRAPRYQVDTFRSPFRAGIDPMKLNQLTDELAAEAISRRTRM
jgi:hypothetical protein